MTTAKAWLAIAGSILAAAIAVVDDGTVTAEEVGFIVTTLMTAFGVWAVPNRRIDG